MRLLPALARTSFAAFVVSLLLGVTAASGTRLGFWDYSFGLTALMPWCVCIGAVGFLLGLIWMVWAAVANRGAGARYGVVGLLGSIAVIATPLYDFYLAKTAPMIHDISTDTEHPPEFASLLPLRGQGLRPGETLNPPDYDGAKPAKGAEGETASTATLQRKYYPDLRASADLVPPAKLFDRALATTKRMGWRIVAADPKQGRIEATDTSFWFGLTNDIVIRVRPAGVGARLDIRSKSRVGVSDMGGNAERIRSFMKTLASTD
jgi:hypothetical protein